MISQNLLKTTFWILFLATVATCLIGENTAATMLLLIGTITNAWALSSRDEL